MFAFIILCLRFILISSFLILLQLLYSCVYIPKLTLRPYSKLDYFSACCCLVVLSVAITLTMGQPNFPGTIPSHNSVSEFNMGSIQVAVLYNRKYLSKCPSFLEQHRMQTPKDFLALDFLYERNCLLS